MEVVGLIPQEMWAIVAARARGSLVATCVQLNDCKGSEEQSTFSRARSPGFLNICGRTLHHLQEEGGRRRERAHSHRQIVALAAKLSRDLTLWFQFQIQMQHSSSGTLTVLSPSLSVSFSSLVFAFLLHSVSPFHLIPSCSQFAFSISKRFEANARLKTPPPPPPETELRDSLPFFLLSIFLFTVSSIFHPCLSAPPLPGRAFSLHFFYYWLYCSSLKNWFLDRGK